MKNLNTYIIEQLISEKILINKNTEVENRYSEWDPNTQYDKDAVYSWIKILRYTSPNAEYNDYEKMKNYYRKGSNPRRLINSIKNKEKLCKRFDIAIHIHWLEYAEIAKDEILARKYFNKDQINTYIEYLYNTYSKLSKNKEIQDRIDILNTLRYWAK